MTPTQRRTYSRKYQSMQKALERKHLPAVYRALRSQVREYAATIRQGGDISLSLFNPHIERVIRRLYLEAGLAGATKTRAEIRSLPEQVRVKALEQRLLTVKTFAEEARVKAASFGTNDELVAAVIDYLTRFLLDKSVRTISETTREWVLKQISEGVAQGRGAYEIAKELVGHEFLKFQALRIVRTETVRAANAGTRAAMDASPYEVQKEWISAHDNRTRHSHRSLDGVLREVDEEFLPGLGQPGDPRAAAKEVINCRCTVATVAKRDANGRLIRKPVQMNPVPTTTIQQFLRTA